MATVISGTTGIQTPDLEINTASYPQLRIDSGSREWTIFNHTGEDKLVFKDNTGGADRMTIDSSGRVTMPYQPAFSTTKNDGSVSGSNTQVVFNEVQLNIGNCYNSSTGAFTAPVSGTYQFYVYGMFSNSARTGWLQLTGNDVWIEEFNPYQELGLGSFDWNQVNGSLLVYLNAGDYVKVRLGTSGGMGSFYATGNRHNGFSGHLIG